MGKQKTLKDVVAERKKSNQTLNHGLMFKVQTQMSGLVLLSDAR